MRELIGHGQDISGLSFSVDGSWLASADSSGVIICWDALAGEQFSRAVVKRPARIGVAFAPSGDSVVVAANRPFVWQPDSGRRDPLLSGETRCNAFRAIFDPAGAALAILEGYAHPNQYGGRIVIVDWPGGVLIADWAREVLSGGLMFSSDGRRIVFGCATLSRAPAEWARLVRIRDVGSGDLVHELGSFTQPVIDLGFTSDDRHVVTISTNHLEVREIATGDQLAHGKANGTQFRTLATTPDGRLVLIGSNDGTVRIWDATSWSELRSFDWGVGRVTALAVAPDGLRFAAGGGSGAVVIWDLDV